MAENLNITLHIYLNILKDKQFLINKSEKTKLRKTLLTPL